MPTPNHYKPPSLLFVIYSPSYICTINPLPFSPSPSLLSYLPSFPLFFLLFFFFFLANDNLYRYHIDDCSGAKSIEVHDVFIINFFFFKILIGHAYLKPCQTFFFSSFFFFFSFFFQLLYWGLWDGGKGVNEGIVQIKVGTAFVPCFSVFVHMLFSYLCWRFVLYCTIHTILVHIHTFITTESVISGWFKNLKTIHIIYMWTDPILLDHHLFFFWRRRITNQVACKVSQRSTSIWRGKEEEKKEGIASTVFSWWLGFV